MVDKPKQTGIDIMSDGEFWKGTSPTSRSSTSSTSCWDVKASAYSIEAADVQHELDYKVWEETKFPEGRVFIPGVIAHKPSTVEPPELVADRIVRTPSHTKCGVRPRPAAT